MAPFPVRQYDGVRPQGANLPGDTHLVFLCDFQARIRQAEVLTVAHAEYARRRRSLAPADLGGAAAPHLALGQVEDAYLVSALDHADQRPAAGQLDIIGMRRNGEQIEFHRASGVAPAPALRSPRRLDGSRREFAAPSQCKKRRTPALIVGSRTAAVKGS